MLGQVWDTGCRRRRKAKWRRRERHEKRGQVLEASLEEVSSEAPGFKLGTLRT